MLNMTTPKSDNNIYLYFNNINYYFDIYLLKKDDKFYPPVGYQESANNNRVI